VRPELLLLLLLATGQAPPPAPDAEAERLLPRQAAEPLTAEGLSRAREVLEHAVREEESREAPDRSRLVALLGNLSSYLLALGEPEAARGALERCLRLAEELGDRPGIAKTLGNLGTALVELGHAREALDALERARAIFRELGDPLRESDALSNLAMVCLHLGRYARALECLERALAEKRRLGDRAGEAQVLATMGNVHATLGREDRARECYEKALPALARRHVGGARVNLGNVLLRLGRTADALEMLERARAELTASGQRAAAAAALQNLGIARAAHDRPERALAALRQALEEWRTLDEPVGIARTLAEIGLVRERQGQTEEAQRCYREAGRAWEAAGWRQGVCWHLGRLAGLQLQGGDLEGALRSARESVELWLELGEGLVEEEATGLREQARFAADAGLRAAALRARRDPRSADAALREAVWHAEAGRALLLADVLVNREAVLLADVEPGLLQEERQARRRVASLRERRGGAPPSAAERTAAARALEDARTRLQRAARRAAPLVFPRPATLEELKEAIPPDGVLVLYQLTSDEALVLVVTREAASLHELGRTEDLTARVQELLDAASWEGSDEEALARELFGRLLAPLERPLAGKRRLVVSPDGILAFLPFEALARGDGTRVLDAWEVSYVPSGTVLAALRSDASAGRRGAGLLAVGDPGAAPPRLPGSADEVRSIGALFEPEQRRLLLGAEASLTRLQAELAREGRRVFAFHLACHGRLDAEHPRQTGLVLAGGEVLTLDELHRLRVPAGLAVLSACESGRGRLLRGEGVLGLVRGFFAAGAPRVVASAWKVDDEATRRLMVAFYGKMVRDGLGAAAALRAAKQELRRAGGRFAHPSRWAAFVLWGLWD